MAISSRHSSLLCHQRPEEDLTFRGNFHRGKRGSSCITRTPMRPAFGESNSLKLMQSLEGFITEAVSYPHSSSLMFNPPWQVSTLIHVYILHIHDVMRLVTCHRSSVYSVKASILLWPHVKYLFLYVAGCS